METKFHLFCDNCSWFDPVVEKIYCDNSVAHQIITCKDFNRCEHIARAIKKQLKEKTSRELQPLYEEK